MVSSIRKSFQIRLLISREYQCFCCLQESHCCEDRPKAMMADPTNSSLPVCLITPDFQDSTNLPASVKPTRITLAVVNGVAALPTFVINLLIIWTVLEKKNLRSNSYTILLAGLAFTDLLVSLITEPATSLQLGCLIVNCHQTSCLYTIVFISGLICLSMSMSTLMMVSLERYLAIQHPFFHHKHVTSKRLTITTIFAWVITPTAILVAKLSLASTNIAMKKIPGLLIIAVHVVVILYCTVRVQIAAYRQRKAIITQIVAVQMNNQNNDSNQAQELRARLQEHNNALTMVVLVMATLVCYCPIIITVIIESVHGKNVTEDFQYIAQGISVTFVSLQSLLNPLIVSLRASNIRAGVKKKLSCCSRITSVEPITISGTSHRA